MATVAGGVGRRSPMARRMPSTPPGSSIVWIVPTGGIGPDRQRPGRRDGGPGAAQPNHRTHDRQRSEKARACHQGNAQCTTAVSAPPATPLLAASPWIPRLPTSSRRPTAAIRPPPTPCSRPSTASCTAWPAGSWRRGGGQLSLGATTLLHEAYLDMSGRAGTAFPDRPRFMGYAARVMRGAHHRLRPPPAGPEARRRLRDHRRSTPASTSPRRRRRSSSPERRPWTSWPPWIRGSRRSSTSSSSAASPSSRSRRCGPLGAHRAARLGQGAHLPARGAAARRAPRLTRRVAADGLSGSPDRFRSSW